MSVTAQAINNTEIRYMAHTNQSKEALKNLKKTFRLVDKLFTDLDQLTVIEIRELLSQAETIKYNLSVLLEYKKKSLK